MSGRAAQGPGVSLAGGSTAIGRHARGFTGPQALVLAAISLALEGGAITLLVANLRGGAPMAPSANLGGGSVLGIAFPLVGAPLAARRRGNAIGWIFLAFGLSQATNAFTNQNSLLGLAP
jgi:hypothetical protein